VITRFVTPPYTHRRSRRQICSTYFRVLVETQRRVLASYCVCRTHDIIYSFRLL